MTEQDDFTRKVAASQRESGGYFIRFEECGHVQVCFGDDPLGLSIVCHKCEEGKPWITQK